MINVLVIGSGAYVSGKNSKGFGTILPSLIEGTRQKIIDKITVVSSSHNDSMVLAKILKYYGFTLIKHFMLLSNFYKCIYCSI